MPRIVKARDPANIKRERRREAEGEFIRSLRDVEERFTDQERQRLLQLAVDALADSKAGDAELSAIITMLAGVDTVLVTTETT